MDIQVSCIIPVKDGGKYLRECLNSLIAQNTCINIEICIYDDGSFDDTPDIISHYRTLFVERNRQFVCGRGEIPGGVGFAKNRAVQLSHGKYLCFCDADDVNLSNRLQSQFDFCVQLVEKENCIIGSNFSRIPEASTPRFTQWACSLSNEQLYTQIYTSFGPTVIAPTWFLSRALYDRLGGFAENYKIGFPEDLDFFYRTLKHGAKIYKVEQNLVLYRYHPQCSTHSVNEKIIWDIRVAELEQNVLNKWTTFTIWNAGKQGKRFFRCLSIENQRKVVGMCDIDEKKITRGKFEVYDEQLRQVTFSIPIINYHESRPPVIICMKLYMTNGVFESCLAEKQWHEGIDFFHFN